MVGLLICVPYHYDVEYSLSLKAIMSLQMNVGTKLPIFAHILETVNLAHTPMNRC